MAQLPYVLAGPVLRRSSQAQVCVWVALSRPLADGEYLDLEVYLADKLPTPADGLQPRRSRLAIGASYLAKDRGELPPRLPKANTSITYLKVARNLHVYLVRAAPFKGCFPAGADLAYELFAVEPAAKPAKLARYPFCEHLQPDSPTGPRKGRKAPVYRRGYDDDPERPKGPASPAQAPALLAFAAQWRPEVLIGRTEPGARGGAHYFRLPTFVLQDSSEDLRVWAGSCLKPHGIGESATALMYRSAAASGGKPGRLPEAMAASRGRPHALFLMGDQIYADDVSFILFEGVKELAKLLLGGADEKLPRPDGRVLSSLTAAARHELVKKGNKFTPLALEKDVQNQLFGLGEFCAYYLMLLNPALWPDLQLARARARQSMATLGNLPQDRLDREYKALVQSRAALRDYAAVMAHVPSYAICDDHEVTDDWFFNKAWIDQVKEAAAPSKKGGGQVKVSPTGQYLVANALYAYAVFQGLGNDPDGVAGRLASSGGIPDDANYASVLAQLLKSDWSFTTPTRPVACFLDTRTQRSGEGNSEYGLASTVVEYSIVAFDRDTRDMEPMMMVGLESLRALIGRAGVQSGGILLVTPSPLLASDGVEKMKRAFGGTPAELDEELWRSNYSNYFMLVDELRRAGIQSCVNLSGDVHYGYRRRARIVDPSPKEEAFRRATKTPPDKAAFLTIEQLVCSPLLNKFDHRFLALLTAGQKLGFQQDYDFAKRYTRTQGQLPRSSNAWIVELAVMPRLHVAQPSYVEHTEPLSCPCSDGQDEPGVIVDNHFLEVSLGRQAGVRPVFHVARSGG